MKPQQAKQFAVMSVERGETIAGMWVAPPVTDIGTYKLVAKQTLNGSCEWAHFVQRSDGRRDKVYRGTVECAEHLEDVLTAINAALRRTFGPKSNCSLLMLISLRWMEGSSTARCTSGRTA